MKKIVLTFITVLMMLSMTALPVMAMECSLDSASPATVQPRIDETKWFNRMYNGKKQMRLWSITEGCWLTDWIDCP